MKMRKIASCLGVLGACLAISSAAIAEDNCSGYTVGVGDARVSIYDDHTFPAHLATGECHVIGPGTSECNWKDKDGDEYSDISKWKEFGTEGTWRTASGTGKYTIAVGATGWWKLVQSGPINVWAWGGYCPLADKK